MAKEIHVIAWCDYPGCADAHPELSGVGQETNNVEFQFYKFAAGRRPAPVKVEMCDEHIALMRGLFTHLNKFNQKEAESDS